jgi:hypothetical protein
MTYCIFLLAGISLAGDEELLAGPKEAQAPKRDEWMTTLPPERKVNDKNNNFSIVLQFTNCLSYITCINKLFFFT